MNSMIQCQQLKRLWMPFCLLVFMVVCTFKVEGQEKPPRPISVTVNTAQHLSFGAFIQSGANGTVTVDYTGGRSCTGNIILPNIFSIISPALFIVDAEPGTLITIVNGPPVNLSGSNGGNLNLQVGPSSIGNPFITRSQTTEVFIGGTLTVGSIEANPAGNYSGTFQVTFIQQ